MRSLVIILALISAPAMAADYTPWPGREGVPASFETKEAPQLAQACCKHCTKGQPCGNTCISAKAKCKTAPGCAC
jgi:hypothetical protein